MPPTTRTRRRFTAQQEAEAIGLCLQEGLSCIAVAERLGLPSSSLPRWLRLARIDRGQPPQEPGPSHQQGECRTQPAPQGEPWAQEGEGLLQAGGSALGIRAAAAERFRLIDQLAAQHSLARLCAELGVTRSGF